MTSDKPSPISLDYEPRLFGVEDVHMLLAHLSDMKVSDIKIQSNNYIYAKWHGRVCRVTRRALSPHEVDDFLKVLYGPNGPAILKSGRDINRGVDFSPSRGTRYRFRLNAVGGTRLGQKAIEMTIRPMPPIPPTTSELGLEPDLVEAAFPLDGMVIFCGKTGSGKTMALSSLMRSMIEDPESNRFIAMYEDPIEIVYDGIESPSTLLFQTEIGQEGDLLTFLEATANGMRRAPDAVLFGECRGLQTIEAVSAVAESGHTVYTTLHAKSIKDLFNRVSNWYPSESRVGQMNNLLSLMRLVVWQRLFVLPAELGPGRFAIREYLVFTDDIRSELAEIGAVNIQKMLIRLDQIVEEKGHSAKSAAKRCLEEGRMTEKDYRLFCSGLI